MFAVVRHPDIDAVGICPDTAFEAHQARGFYRVSDWRDDPSTFYLPEYADGVDLDAPEPAEEPEPQPDEKPAKTKKESSE